MKKLYELGEMTGLTRREVGRVARFGILGLLAFGLAGLVGCFRTQKSDAVQAPGKTETLQDLVNSVQKSTAPAKPPSQADCGPYPGYPCGTRYHTVSRADFSGLA